MRKKTAQIAWIFQRMFDASHEVMTSRNNGPYVAEVSGSISLGLIYDESIDLICDFMQAFPGRAKPNETNAMARLSKLLKALVDDGWISRFRISNFKEYIGEAGTWSYGYYLDVHTYRKMKSGDWTPESMARRYQGDMDMLKDGNSYYSAAQLEEIASKEREALSLATSTDGEG